MLIYRQGMKQTLGVSQGTGKRQKKDAPLRRVVTLVTNFEGDSPASGTVPGLLPPPAQGRGIFRQIKARTDERGDIAEAMSHKRRRTQRRVGGKDPPLADKKRRAAQEGEGDASNRRVVTLVLL
ncbi:hypothetical protein B5V00_09180 [Geothermobacter hydrogeniphilus]|uniref:Uncharacterized protein n=1 Tax=Geothermobacter hydrogeniphilus TaxID=1969733 RepID=A0A1X0Y3V4_9BACT|nr:hypothetical protein B5V00_09180 [Geothermobacter hydrogeniphilus]